MTLEKLVENGLGAGLVGAPAVWRNPGDDADGTGCTTWENMQECINYPGDPVPAGPDFEFQLRGIDQ